MFYPAVEEYVMQNRQRELAKDLELRRQLRDSLESKSVNRLHFLAEVGGKLRKLGRVYRRDTHMLSGFNAPPRDCATC